MKVVILAGGKGSRLKEYTNNMPKPMIKILKKTILEYQMESLKRYGLKDIIISVGYLGKVIKDYFEDGRKFGVNIQYISEDIPMGTGGALNYLKDIIEDDFILLFGDIILNIDWDKMIDFHKKKGGFGTFLVHPNNHPQDSDLMILDDDFKIETISYKNTTRTYCKNIVKSGVHIFNKNILDYVECMKTQDLEKEVVLRAMEKGQSFFAYKTSEYVKDMGTLKRIKQVEKDISDNVLEKKALYNKQKCIFLDRDGTINKLKGLLYDINDFELEENVAEAVKIINDSGYLCIMITNQSVIARNLCTIDELDNIHKKMETLLGEKEAYLDDSFYCPHHPDSGYEGENKKYKIECNCRKPNIQLIKEAVEKYNIDLGKSFIIGDTTVDIKTGENAGIHTVLIKTGEAGTDNKFNVIAEYEADNLYEAVKLILKKDVR